MRTPVYRPATFVPGVGFYCGTCSSPDDWVEVPTDVGCGNCGTLLVHDQLDAFYDHVDSDT